MADTTQHPAGVHLYRCTWNDKIYGARSERIFALDDQHARDIVHDMFDYQGSVRELNVQEIEMREVHRVKREGEVLVKESATRSGEKVAKEYYVPVTRFYCSHCNNQVMPAGTFCDKCGGYFTKGSEF